MIGSAGALLSCHIGRRTGQLSSKRVGAVSYLHEELRITRHSPTLDLNIETAHPGIPPIATDGTVEWSSM